MASHDRHDRYETYASSNLRVEYLHDEKGKRLKTILCLKIYTIIGALTTMVIKVGIVGTGKKCGCWNKLFGNSGENMKNCS